jgi:hypothetical protein
MIFDRYSQSGIGDMDAYVEDNSHGILAGEAEYFVVIDRTFYFPRKVTVALFRDNLDNSFDLFVFDHSAKLDRIRDFERVSYSIVDRIIALAKACE